MRALVLEFLKDKVNFKLYEHNDDEWRSYLLSILWIVSSCHDKLLKRERMDELLFDDED